MAINVWGEVVAEVFKVRIVIGCLRRRETKCGNGYRTSVNWGKYYSQGVRVLWATMPAGEVHERLEIKYVAPGVMKLSNRCDSVGLSAHHSGADGMIRDDGRRCEWWSRASDRYFVSARVAENRRC